MNTRQPPLSGTITVVSRLFTVFVARRNSPPSPLLAESIGWRDRWPRARWLMLCSTLLTLFPRHTSGTHTEVEDAALQRAYPSNPRHRRLTVRGVRRRFLFRLGQLSC